MKGLGWSFILLAILIWLLYRLYKKPKIYTDKPREDYIIEDTREEHKSRKRKPKKTKIEELLSNRKKEQEELAKEREKNTPKFEVGDNEVKCNFRGKTFLLDKEGYKFFYSEFIINGGLSIINGYLAIDNPANNYPLFFHRRFVRIEIEDFCEKNNCEGKDIEVHHIDYNKKNNKKENLQVMLKTEHRKLPFHH